MKFLFVVNDLNIGGGIASALINLSNILVEKGHFVDFFNLSYVDVLPEYFDKRIKLINRNDRANLYGLSIHTIKREKGVKKIFYLFLALIKKLTHKTFLWQKICFSKTHLEGYDVAVAFRQSPLNYWLIKHNVMAKVRIGFWHGDPDSMKGIDGWKRSLKCVDYIACVSNAVTEKMKLHYPSISNKMKTVYNIFNSKDIVNKANKFDPVFNKDVFNIVTVSRIEFSQKQLNIIPLICSNLKNNGYKIAWYILGDGSDKSELEKIINECKVNKEVLLLGNKDNPYPYIKNADLFCLTSLWEAYGMVLTESLILNTPCVAGYYSALPEIIEDDKNGLIAENSIEGIEEKIENILTDKELYKKLKVNAEAFIYDYSIAYNQLMKLCDEKYEV